jgi:hypothetical protein
MQWHAAQPLVQLACNRLWAVNLQCCRVIERARAVRAVSREPCSAAWGQTAVEPQCVATVGGAGQVTHGAEGPVDAGSLAH